MKDKKYFPDRVLILSEPKALVPNPLRPRCTYSVRCAWYVPGESYEKNDDGSIKYQWPNTLAGDIATAPPIGSVIQFANEKDLVDGIWSYATL